MMLLSLKAGPWLLRTKLIGKEQEWQSRAGLEEGVQCILGVRQVEGRDLSSAEKAHRGTASFFLGGAFASLALTSPSRASLVLQGSSPGSQWQDAGFPSPSPF